MDEHSLRENLERVQRHLQYAALQNSRLLRFAKLYAALNSDDEMSDEEEARLLGEFAAAYAALWDAGDLTEDGR